jgi:hypothetical protein
MRIPSIKEKYFDINGDLITFSAAFLVWKDVKWFYVSLTALKYEIFYDNWEDDYNKEDDEDLLYFLNTL